jgi:hypothetical protein
LLGLTLGTNSDCMGKGLNVRAAEWVVG